MTPPTSTARGLARWLLAEESRGGEPDQLADALERVCAKLRRHIGGYAGTAGFEALMSRALRRASDSYPVLAGVDVGDGESACLVGVAEGAAKHGDEQAAAAFAELLTNFLWLLFTFLGTDLSMRLLNNTWPDAALEQTKPGTREEEK